MTFLSSLKISKILSFVESTEAENRTTVKKDSLSAAVPPS